MDTFAVARDDLATVALSGTDTLRYLHAVSSQHTAELPAGAAREALLLSPKGKIEHAFRLAVVDGGAVLDTDAAAAGPLAERLARFLFRYQVTVGDPRAGAVSLLGDAAAAHAAAGLPAPPAEGHATVTGAGDDLLVAHRTPLGTDLVGPGAAAALKALEAAGVTLAPLGLWEAHRIALGIPRWGRELTDDVLAEEAGLLGSHVHLDKGCYPGQETVARVHNLGQLARRLASLRFGDGEAPPEGSDLVTEDGRRAGQLRSAARHPDLGVIGLGYVGKAVADGQRVLAAGRPATVAPPGRQS